MEELIEFRRNRNTRGQWKCNVNPYVKLELPRGQFVFFKNTMDLMEFKHNTAVMFKFNRKDKCAYVFKEEPQDDSYYLRDNSRGYSRFTCKELMLFFCEIFDIKDENNIYFLVEKLDNNWFKLTQE